MSKRVGDSRLFSVASYVEKYPDDYNRFVRLAFSACLIRLVTLLIFPGQTIGAQQPVIDAHVHTIFDGKDKTPEALLEQWREAGVVGGIAHLNQQGEGGGSWPGLNIVQCIGVGASIRPAAVEKAIRSGRYKCIKVYLGYAHRYAADPAYQPLYRIAQKYDVPVVFHTGDTYTKTGKLKYADPLTIDEVAVDFPKTTFVLAHCGNPWIQSAAEVAYKNPNVYLECSAFVIGDLSKMSEEYLKRYMIEPISWIFGYVEDPTKMMFGSDWPLTNVKLYLEAFKRAIPEKYWPLVLHDNAKRVFKLNAPTSLKTSP
jgi:uncharacterized protein